MQIEINGQKKRINDKDLIRIEQGLKVSREEALQIYLEDEGIYHNAEQEALCEKAEKSGVLRTVHDAMSEEVVQKKMKNETTRKKTTKPQPDKEHIISMIRVLLEGHEKADNVCVENPTKILTFNYNGNPYKINLTATRTVKD